MHMGVHMLHSHHVYTALTIYDMDWWPLQRANTMLAWILNWVKALKIHAYSNLDFKFANPSKNEWHRIWFEVVLFKFMSRTLRSLCSIFRLRHMLFLYNTTWFSRGTWFFHCYWIFEHTVSLDLVLSLELDLWTYRRQQLKRRQIHSMRKYGWTTRHVQNDINSMPFLSLPWR